MLTKRIRNKYAYGSGRKKLVLVAIPFVSRPHVFRVTARLMMAITIRKWCSRYKVDIKYSTRVWLTRVSRDPRDTALLSHATQRTRR